MTPCRSTGESLWRCCSCAAGAALATTRQSIPQQKTSTSPPGSWPILSTEKARRARHSGRGVQSAIDTEYDLSIRHVWWLGHCCLTLWLAVVGMSSPCKTISELASICTRSCEWTGGYGSVPRQTASRKPTCKRVRLQAISPGLRTLERVVCRISWQFSCEAWDVVTGMTCESPREHFRTPGSPPLQGWEASHPETSPPRGRACLLNQPEASRKPTSGGMQH